MKLFLTVVAIALGTIAFPNSSRERSRSSPMAGMLTCVVDPVVGSNSYASGKRVSCTYRSAADGITTRYSGTFEGYATQISNLDGEEMAWLVRAPEYMSAISGRYRQPSAVEADFQTQNSIENLSNDNDPRVILEPAMLLQYGLNFAIGVKALHLTPQ